MKKKVVFLINSLEGGGAERVVSTLLNKFSSTHECYLILIEDSISYDIDCNVNIIRLNESSSFSGLVKLLRLPLVAYKLMKVIKERRFSKVVSFLHRSNYINLMAGFFGSHFTVISERIAPTSAYNGFSLKSLANRFLIRGLYSRADFLIPVSFGVKYDLEYNFSIKACGRVVYNPYDIDKIMDFSSHAIGFEIKKSNAMICVGSFRERKRHKDLIRAFSKIRDPDCILYLLGEGECELNLRKLVNELRLEKRVIFLGFDNNPYKYLSKCDIFVLSSESEGFPNVLAEALICGCCVISTDCLSGPREILAPKTNLHSQIESGIEFADYGVLTPVGDVVEMSNAMNFILENDSMRLKYQELGMNRGADFSIGKISEEYTSILFDGE